MENTVSSDIERIVTEIPRWKMKSGLWKNYRQRKEKRFEINSDRTGILIY